MICIVLGTGLRLSNDYALNASSSTLVPITSLFQPGQAPQYKAFNEHGLNLRAECQASRPGTLSCHADPHC